MRRRLRAFFGSLGLAAALGLASPAEAVVVERIVAVVGDKAILLSDLRTRGRPFLLQIQERVPPGPQQAAAESQMFKELMQRLVDEELETQAAERAKVTVSAEEIDNAIRAIAAQQKLTVTALVKEATRQSGLTEQDYRDEIRRQLLEGKMIQLRVKGRARITEEDLKVAFDRTVREERKLREYHPAWIVLRVLPGSSPEAVEERRRLAESIAQRAAAGEEFADLAKAYSDDTPTRDVGGDLGVRAPVGTQAALTGRRQVMAPEFEAALLALEPGGVTGPFRAGDAYVVLKLLSRQPSRYTTFEAARPEMAQRVQADILEKAKKKWLEELRKRTHVDVRL